MSNNKKSDDFIGELVGLFVVIFIAAITGMVEHNKHLQKFRKAGVVIGKASGRQISIPHEVRLKHTHVMGATGSGKTTLLTNMAKQDMETMNVAGEPAYGVGVIDPKGDLVDRLLMHIPRHRRKDVIIFDPTDTENPLGFNILENVPEQARSQAASMVIATFKKLFGKISWGPRMEHVLRYAVLTLMEVPGSTLLDIPILLLNDEFREGVLPHVTNFAVANFWQHEYAQYVKGSRMTIIAPILNRIGPWVAYPEVRNIIGQVQSSFDLRKVIDEKKIFLARLPEGLLGEDTRQILGALLITRFQLAAVSRASIPENQRQPFILYVDEFQNFVTEASQKIVTEGRSFGLGLVVANQHEAQLRGQSGLQESLAQNVAAHLLLYNNDMGNFCLQYSRLQDCQPGAKPPTIQVSPLPALPFREGAASVAEGSKHRFGRDRDWVEHDILRRMSHGRALPDGALSPNGVLPANIWSSANFFEPVGSEEDAEENEADKADEAEPQNFATAD